MGVFLKSVTDLNLSHNNLASFPLCLLNMPLQSLDLSNNQV